MDPEETPKCPLEVALGEIAQVVHDSMSELIFLPGNNSVAPSHLLIVERDRISPDGGMR